MIKSNTAVDVDYKIEVNQQDLTRYPMQYELTFAENQLQMLQHPYIEVCPSCGALSMESESRRREKMKMNELPFIFFQSNPSQLSLNLAI